MVVNESIEISDLKKIFMEEGMFTIRVTALGPNLCLLEDLVLGEVETFIEERRNWWEGLFKLIKPWNPGDIDEERMLWIKISRIPCHAWGVKLFKVIAERYGSYIRSDEQTITGSVMSEACILIKTKRMDLINETMNILIEDSCFILSVREASIVVETTYKAPKKWNLDDSGFSSPSMVENSEDEVEEDDDGVSENVVDKSYQKGTKNRDGRSCSGVREILRLVTIGVIKYHGKGKF